MPRVALALVRGSQIFEERDPPSERRPRGHVFEEAFSPVYDERIIEQPRGPLASAIGRAPIWLQLALEIQRRRDEYDVIVTWGERLTLALMAVQSLAREKKAHVPMMYWFSKPNISIPVSVFGKSAHSIVTWSSVQRRWAIEHLGIGPDRIHLIKYFADQAFWHPIPGPDDMICSAGSEMRDYPTLIEALKGTDLRCHIASDKVRVNRGPFRHELVSVSELARVAGASVTSGPMNPTELRALYARSRFVVIPVLPSDTDNGVSVMLEAMAMGKPVICSRTVGQVDVLEDGVTGLFVPVGDPVALREAMLELWRDPDRARAMGARARERVEKYHTLERFTADVRAAAELAATDQLERQSA